MLKQFSLIAMVVAASPAAAFDASKLGQGGSLPLSDISSLVNQSAQLKGEVAAALAAAHKTADNIICGGNRFPREWVNLGGMRAAPYMQLHQQMAVARRDHHGHRPQRQSL